MFTFEEIGLQIDNLPYGSFSGSFDLDRWGMIETIRIDTDPHCEVRKQFELKSWRSTEMLKPADKRYAPDWKHCFFDALAKELERRHQEQIEEFMEDLRTDPAHGLIEDAA